LGVYLTFAVQAHGVSLTGVVRLVVNGVSW